MSSISVTGLRPSKLPPQYGYDYKNEAWTKIKNSFKEILLEKNCTDAYTGMALGVDTVFAHAVLELKEQGHNIKLHCILPCAGQEKQWPDKSKDMYIRILTWADEIIGMTEEGYLELLMDYEIDFFKKTVKSHCLISKNPLRNEPPFYSQQYKPYLMQKRNEYMVDHADEVIAVWNGNSGGTKNCVEYAIKQQKLIHRINP